MRLRDVITGRRQIGADAVSGRDRFLHPLNVSSRFVHAITWTLMGLSAQFAVAEQDSIGVIRGHLERFCFECHSEDHSEAGVNLQRLATETSFAPHFRIWQRVTDQLHQGRMPPQEGMQPDDLQRQQLLAGVRTGLRQAVDQYAGDPGRVVIRRLTSAEYVYTVRDLTGLDLMLDQGFGSDAVGGAGFTNTGIVQFIQDSTLERYLEAARQISDRAVLGAGPLTFYQDPGQIGFELSAVHRIQKIYRLHGFRTAAGEFGEAFGLEKFPRSFFVAWRYKHREKIGCPDSSISSLAEDEEIEPRFAEYIYQLMGRDDLLFPTSEIVDSWRQLPVPEGPDEKLLLDVRQQCDEITKQVHTWQSRFAENADDPEQSPVLREDLFHATKTHAFEMDLTWPEESTTLEIVVTIEPAMRNTNPDSVVIWRNPEIQFLLNKQATQDPQPLRKQVTLPVEEDLKFGLHPRGGKIGPDDFVTIGAQSLTLELPIPTGVNSARLQITPEIDTTFGEDCIVRSKVELKAPPGVPPVSGLLANDTSAEFKSWKSGVFQFARLLPPRSHGEPAPSDRDPIPPLIDSKYNNPERNNFHSRIKYYRDDKFLVNNILDGAVRERLDQAWDDVLGSFEFHDWWLRFIAQKFGNELGDRTMANLDAAWIDDLPSEARLHVQKLHREFHSIHASFEAAQDGHVEDVVQLAARAWRRPLLASEAERLRSYYRTLRTDLKLEHRVAVGALISRVFVSPEFLYRAEHVTEENQTTALSDFELASRLSYFLWSSLPDEELRRAAEEGELSNPQQLVQQAQRMLKDPKAERFATEFFGQWFGFYRFDQHRGVDPERFPEFVDSLKRSMYQEAIAFFDHVVRNNRPANEILFANYSFLNRQLAEHYGVDVDLADERVLQKVDDVGRFHRGGLLRLGAVLTLTSAPRRTSPVKRGDWVLRRTLGTAVPPPPADAGSIPADDVLADGLSVPQRLEAHRRDVACVNCHSRFDALGFALEGFDPLGRWRDQYRDGNPIDTSGELRDGTRISGEDGLHEYLASQQDRFHRTLCTKLLGYALGRQESVGDLPLVEQMQEHLARGGGLSELVECLVGSRQFRYHGVMTEQP